MQCRRPWFDSWVGKIYWRRGKLPTPVSWGFPHGSAGKKSACNAGDLGLIPGLVRSPGEGKGYPLQYSGLENSLDCIVHGVTKSWTPLSDFHNLLHSFTICKIESQWEFPVWLRETILGLCDYLKRWSRRCEGGSRGRGHMYTYGWFMLVYG